MNHFLSFFINDDYEVGAEKRREEKRRGNLNHPVSRDRGCCSCFTTALYNNKILPTFLWKGSCMIPFSSLAGRFDYMPALSKLQIIRSSQMKNAFKYVIIKRWFVAFKHSIMAFKRSIIANKHSTVAYKLSIVAFNLSIMINKYSIMAIKRLFMAHVNPNAAYVDSFVATEKALTLHLGLKE